MLQYSTIPMVWVNIAGCAANESGENTASGCPAKIDAVTQCQIAACDTGCNKNGQLDPEFNACSSLAVVTVCKDYQAAALACQPNLFSAGANATACLSAQNENLLAWFERLGWLFCGSEPATDGGTPDAEAGIDAGSPDVTFDSEASAD
jgi:hypothetical protein